MSASSLTKLAIHGYIIEYVLYLTLSIISNVPTSRGTLLRQAQQAVENSSIRRQERSTQYQETNSRLLTEKTNSFEDCAIEAGVLIDMYTD